MSVEFPRCVRCRVVVRAGLSVVFRPDGRVEHAACPEVFCRVCSRTISPGAPIRRDADEIVHANCWMKRRRARAQPVS